jgi:hypothetical protein
MGVMVMETWVMQLEKKASPLSCWSALNKENGMARIEQSKFQDDEIYPVEASAWGKNAFYHNCEVVGHSPAFCICVNKLNAYKRGQRNFNPECIAAIEYNQCGAVKMLAAEVEKGQAIHFVNRTKLQEFNRGQEERAQSGFAPRESRTPAKPVFESARIKAMFDDPSPAPTVKAPVIKPVSTSFSSDGYAAAINAAVKQESQPLAAVVARAPSVPATGGMSLIEMARQQLAAKTTN